YGCGNYSIGFMDAYLEPNTTYTVTLKEGLKDIYGQLLENPQTVTFNTGGLTPKMWGPRGYQIITPKIEPKLGVKTVNINKIFYKLLSLKPKDILVRESLDGHYTIKKLISEIKSEEKQFDITLNDSKVGKAYFDLKPYLADGKYGVTAYSFKSPINECSNYPIKFNGLILRTNIGIYTQFHPTVGIIKLNKLTDGEPISNAKIKVYREEDLPRLNKIWDIITNTYHKKITPCYEGITDASGTLILSAAETAKCTKRRIKNKILNELYPPEADQDDILYDQEKYGFAEPPRLLIVAENGDDWTFMHTKADGNPPIWQFGVGSAWEAERPLSRGILFSDHFIYRPGDTVKIKGISRYLLYGKLLTGEDMEYTIKIRDPHGAQKEIGKVKVNDFGTFTIDIPTKAGQKLGNYQVIAETPYKGLKFYGNFRLAEFRVPEFEVNMKTDKKIITTDEEINISWNGKYYFGAPMSDAKSHLNITRRRTYFKPKGWNGYSFGIPQYLQDRKVNISGRYLKETTNTNKDGRGEKVIELNPEDAPYPMTYHCDVEVEDVSRQTISANKRFTVLPDKHLIGIKLSKWIITKNNKLDVSVIVSSPKGKAISSVPVTVKLIKKEYHSAKT
ncbi:MAG: hypothetical protein KAR38_14020, partial [Calditrichia bacterium]|nr:hypothetical protein [Calditrichia bacterium]